MDRVLQLASRHGIAVIEDAAEAHGAEYLTARNSSEPHWKRCGSFGEMSCFSFYANKLITTGEGGMIVTNSDDFAEKSRLRRNLCFQPGRRFYHEELGFNFRLTNLQAALAIAQMQRMEEILQRKRRMAEQYTENLKEIEWLQLPAQMEWARSVYWMYGVVLNERAGMNADEFAAKLKASGVETRPFFLGMHEQPALHKLGLFQNSKYPVTERLSKKGLYLPSGLALTSDQLSEVCEKVRAILL
jgi:perosamine synthetase